MFVELMSRDRRRTSYEVSEDVCEAMKADHKTRAGVKIYDVLPSGTASIDWNMVLSITEWENDPATYFVVV